MATGTRTSNRIYLQACKEKGADDGWPFIGRYIKTVPDPIPAGMVIDTHIKGAKTTHFQKFDFVSGYLKQLFTEDKEILGKPVKELAIVLGDETTDTTYQFTPGTVNSSYARQLLQRLCNPALDPSQPIEINLYGFKKDDNTPGTALSVKQNGANIPVKDESRNWLPFIASMPEGNPVVVNGIKMTDFTAQVAWLFKTVMATLPADVFRKEAAPQVTTTTPAQPAAPVAPPITVNVPASTVPTTPPTTVDDSLDLPF